MSKSNREIPHYYLETLVPMDRALLWMEAFNRGRPPAERVLPIAVLLKAAARALKEFPDLNGFYIDEAFRPSASVHLGVAIALKGGGLMIPCLHDVDRKDVKTVMAELTDLVARVRAGHVRSSELTDTTATVTSLGDGGVEKVFGVIYPPQVALIGFGGVNESGVVESGRLAVRRTVTATLAADHRASDGLTGSRFLSRLKALLQEPEAL
jgi:pyruvate dehydrogenase E2 component (dihydrolipoamide acetyltransferase)